MCVCMCVYNDDPTEKIRWCGRVNSFGCAHSIVSLLLLYTIIIIMIIVIIIYNTNIYLSHIHRYIVYVSLLPLKLDEVNFILINATTKIMRLWVFNNWQLVIASMLLGVMSCFSHFSHTLCHTYTHSHTHAHSSHSLLFVCHPLRFIYFCLFRTDRATSFNIHIFWNVCSFFFILYKHPRYMYICNTASVCILCGCNLAAF